MSEKLEVLVIGGKALVVVLLLMAQCCPAEAVASHLFAGFLDQMCYSSNTVPLGNTIQQRRSPRWVSLAADVRENQDFSWSAAVAWN